MKAVLITPTSGSCEDSQSVALVNRAGETVALDFVATTWNRVVFGATGRGTSLFMTGHPHKDAWLAKLRSAGHRCKVPRGYFKALKRPVYVG